MPQFCSPKPVHRDTATERSAFCRVHAILAAFGFGDSRRRRRSSARRRRPSRNWVLCGECRGDLNGDGLLNELDLLVFELYREQTPQNPCADFNDNGVVDTLRPADPELRDHSIRRLPASPMCGDPTRTEVASMRGNPGDPDPRRLQRPRLLHDRLPCRPALLHGSLGQRLRRDRQETLPSGPPGHRVTRCGNSLRVHTYEPGRLPRLPCRPSDPGLRDARCTRWSARRSRLLRDRLGRACVALAQVHCQSALHQSSRPGGGLHPRPECCRPGTGTSPARFCHDVLASPATPRIRLSRDTSCCRPVPEPTPRRPGPFQARARPFRTLLCNIDPTLLRNRPATSPSSATSPTPWHDQRSTTRTASTSSTAANGTRDAPRSRPD